MYQQPGPVGSQLTSKIIFGNNQNFSITIVTDFRYPYKIFVIRVNVKKNLDKEGNISHWKMAQKCRIGGMGQCGRKAVSRQCRDVARQQTSVKGHKNFSGCMPGKFFVFAALTLDPG